MLQPHLQLQDEEYKSLLDTKKVSVPSTSPSKKHNMIPKPQFSKKTIEVDKSNNFKVALNTMTHQAAISQNRRNAFSA